MCTDEWRCHSLGKVNYLYDLLIEKIFLVNLAQFSIIMHFPLNSIVRVNVLYVASGLILLVVSALVR